MLFHGFQVNPNNVPLKRAGLYWITCLVNGKPYVGISQNVAGRAKAHGANGNSSPPKFRNAIRKYGKANFLFEPVAYSINDGTDWLPVVEAEWIKMLDAIKHGYNVIAANGGVGPYGKAFGEIISKSARKWQAERTPTQIVTMRANQSEGAKHRWSDPNEIIRNSETQKLKWQDQQYRENHIPAILKGLAEGIQRARRADPKFEAKRRHKISQGHARRTPEEKAAATLKMLKNLPPGRRREAALQDWATLSPSERSSRQRGNSTAEERSARAIRAAAKRDKQENSEQVRYQQAHLTPAQKAAKSERARNLGSNTKWINNGVTNKRLKNGTLLPKGWIYGRIKKQ